MNEYRQVWMIATKLVVWLVFVVLYVLGGRSHRWRRWLVGGLVFAGGLIGVSLAFHTFHWWYLFGLVFYPMLLSNGYSGDTPPIKFRRRALYGLILGACSIVFVTTNKLLLVMFFQTALSTIASVSFGVLNPFKDAPSEEAAIAACSTVLVPMMGG